MLPLSSQNISYEKKSDSPKTQTITIPFKAVSLRAYTMIPMFLLRSEAVLEVLLSQRFQHLLQFSLDLIYGVKPLSLQLDFHIREEENDKRRINQVSVVGDDHHINGGQIFLHSESSASRCLVMMKHPVPFVWPLPPHVLPRLPQNRHQSRSLHWRCDLDGWIISGQSYHCQRSTSTLTSHCFELAALASVSV